MNEEQYNQAGAGIAIVGGLVAALIGLVIALILIISLWKIFTKAGQPGWAAIVPIYNIIVLLQILGKPLWWIVLMFIPFVNFIVGILLAISLAERFGKSAAYGIGIAFLGIIFLPMLAFGDARYRGPALTAG